MEIFISDTYEEMSRQAADTLIELMQSIEYPLLCPGSGHSPLGLYDALVKKNNNTEVDVSEWYFTGLDEWVGMNGTDEGSCRYTMNTQLFDPLKIPDKNICFFDGKAKDLETECEKTENFISYHNGIHVAIVGLGLNGHIAMNEPGTSSNIRSHVSAIDPVTQEAGQKYFKEHKEISKGITLGLANILEAKHVMLVVNGSHKAEIVKRLINEEISEQLPATLLRNHSSFKIYMDSKAAHLL
jgi:galactosamine-6-phosphate isomerase